MRVLTAGASPAQSQDDLPKQLGMQAIQELLAGCVREWDATGSPEGADPAGTLQDTVGGVGATLHIKVSEAVFDKMGFQTALAQCPGEAGMLVTAIPRSEGAARQAMLGNTFLIVSVPSGVHVVDSHAHKVTGQSQRGTLHAWARSSALSQPGARAKAVADWIWGDGGLLCELNCDHRFVTSTVFQIDPAPLDQSLSDWARRARARRGDAAPSISPASKAPKRTSSTAPARRSITHEPKDAVAAPQPSPPPAAQTPPPCTVIGLARPKHDHAKFVADCAQCRWKRSGHAWQEAVSFKDPVSGQAVTPIIEKPEHLGGSWAIGCSVCANFLQGGSAEARGGASSRPNAFAHFRVSAISSIQKCEIVKHCKSMFHSKALASFTSQVGPAKGFSPTAVASGAQPEPACGPPAEQEYSAVCSLAKGVGEQVPRAERWVWAIRSAQRGSSMRDFAEWSKTVDLSSFLTSEGVCRDSSRHACVKMITCVDAVLQQERQRLLRRAVRLSFAIDERDQVFVIGARATVTKPEVSASEFIVAVIRDFGFTAEENCEACLLCFKSLCTVRAGRRSAAPSQCEDYVDEELLAHIAKITFCGASDGCAVPIKAIQLLRERFLPHLRYQFRDRPHTTRTVVKGVLKYMAEGKILLEALITGKKSFAKRATHSCATKAAHAWCGGLASQGWAFVRSTMPQRAGREPRCSLPVHCGMIELHVVHNRLGAVCHRR